MVGKPSLIVPPSSEKSSDVRSETRLLVSKRFLPTLDCSKGSRSNTLCLRGIQGSAKYSYGYPFADGYLPPYLYGASPRASKATSRDVILASSTWTQLATGTGSAPVVCRSYHVSTSGPSTNTFWITMSDVIRDMLLSPPCNSRHLLIAQGDPRT